MNFTNFKNKDLACFGFTAIVLVVCFTLISIYSGFVHEPHRFKTMMVTIILVFFIYYVIYEPIRYLVMAIDYATWPQKDQPHKPEKRMTKQSRIAYLKIRVRSLRSELVITEAHQNEALNQRYKRIAGDLLLYGSYFLALMIMVVMQENQFHYYNTNNMVRLFSDNTSETYGLSEVYFIYQIYNFLEITMVEAFFSPNEFGYDGWWAMDQWQTIGVVRLRQMRPVSSRYGLGTPKWDTTTYAPEWRLPYHRLHYTDKFWRIYDPFRPAHFEFSFLNGLLLTFNHYGYLLNYPELAGYVVLMMGTKTHCLKQVEYLRTNGWVNQNTSALFIDFTMYNADANVFTVITLRVENSPFGTQISRVNVDTVRMLGSVENRTNFEIFWLCIYTILVLEFGRGVVSKVWHDPEAYHQAWNIVDLTICALNIVMLGLTVLRDIETDHLLDMIETYTKGQYLDFQRPLRIHQILSIVEGFLVCITTLRLWKVLQFASVFQHFTRTLFSAWRAVVSLGVIILILLMGIGIALAVPNGNNAVFFHHIIKSVVTCMWYSVGFNAGIVPSDFFHGGRILGILLYMILVFLIAIILMNVFASVIYDYFNETGREIKEQANRSHITFWEFLRIEYMDVSQRFFRCIHRKYERRGRTVAQNVELELKKQEENNKNREATKSQFGFRKEKFSDEECHADYVRRGERMFKLMAILNVQVEILERLVLGDEEGNIPSPPASDSDPEDIPEMYRKRPTAQQRQKY
ncbi:polycystic kidney disease 2-like 2 protein [Drosophila eugracilis]|uniref:polycystic kidney disease 2-like 2 protein n=1 Tax=Drosophila eugracilis TaxID=29029 RepID=UPI0007E858AB|nr:polycystic kidney disease 2-like 2 protein [Drosophila eugracilis]